jgi:hypothetical protein
MREIAVYMVTLQYGIETATQETMMRALIVPDDHFAVIRTDNYDRYDFLDAVSDMLGGEVNSVPTRNLRQVFIDGHWVVIPDGYVLVQYKGINILVSEPEP